MAFSGYAYTLKLLMLRPMYYTFIMLETVVLNACCSDHALEHKRQEEVPIMGWQMYTMWMVAEYVILERAVWHKGDFQLKATEKKQI